MCTSRRSGLADLRRIRWGDAGKLCPYVVDNIKVAVGAGKDRRFTYNFFERFGSYVGNVPSAPEGSENKRANGQLSSCGGRPYSHGLVHGAPKEYSS